MKKSVYIKTFGCQMNKSDSKRLEESFAAYGGSVISDESDADVVIYNTCSVREHAENKALSHIGRLKFLKDKKPSIKICVVGCMAQRMGEEIKKRLPHVDVVAGPSLMFELPGILYDGAGSGVFTDDPENRDYKEFFPGVIAGESEFARYVPIMRGCDNFCSYCIVPYVRGREKYRKKEDIIAECRVLGGKGIKEITLLGQAVNSHPEFKEILKEAAVVKRLKRVRFLTSYPGKMDRETIDIVRENETLCNMFHIPLQSGSDKILKKMKRRYTLSKYLDSALYIRATIPFASISTDFIVGFPGETESDFEKTIDAVKKIKFDQSYTFKYSSRPGTKAAGYEETVTEEEKQDRLKKLNEMCNAASLERNRLFEGREETVFSDGENSGRTGENKIVHFKGSRAAAGEEVRVRIEKALPHSLKGERIN